jgi:hypothetical protein
MKILLVLLQRIEKSNEGKDKIHLDGMKEAYMEIVPEFENSTDQMWKTRLMLRNYFRELNLYTKFT